MTAELVEKATRVPGGKVIAGYIVGYIVGYIAGRGPAFGPGLARRDPG